MRTGVLGGTFDPIHIAHLHVAECALHQFSLDRVLLIPAGDPWQKSDREVTAAEHRLAMCRLAVDGVPGLEADDREMTRNGPTYTIDTLETFDLDEELYLIVGSDSMAGMSTWHRSSDVLERVRIIVAPRPGTEAPDLEALVLDMSPIEVSATEIRARAATGRPFRFLVTGPVHDYIKRHALYPKAGSDDMVVGSKTSEDQS